MRRSILIVLAVAALTVASGFVAYLAKRTVRWNDARTMPPPLSAAVKAYSRGDVSGGLGAVRQLLDRYRAPAWEGRARVLAAVHLSREGRDGEIVEILPRELAAAEPLAPHALLLRARGLLARGDAARAADAASRASTLAGFPGADEARRIRAQALDGAGSWREALSILDGAVPADALLAARICAAHGDHEGARRRLVAALLQGAVDSDVDRLREELEDLEPDAAARLSPEERPRLAPRARHWLEEGRAKLAVDLLQLVRPAGAPSSATPEEALVEAEALLKLSRADEVGPLLGRVRAAAPSLSDGARYLEARRAAALGSYTAYRTGLTALAHRGTAPWRERALLDLARNGEGVPSASTLEAYRSYLSVAGADADPVAVLRKGWAAFELGRSQDAAAAFDTAMASKDTPVGVKAAAGYWRARIDDIAGKTATARTAYERLAADYPNQYYGILSARRLARPLPKASASPPPVPDPVSLGADGRWLAAARQLVSVGLWSDAAPYYRAVARRNGIAVRAVALEAALAARDTGALSDAIAMAQEAVGDRDRASADDVPIELWRFLYPAPSADAIRAAASATALDPDLVAAVALQESAFNPLAVSSAGARGLLQVMPAVGAELARTMGLARFDPADLFDPATNLKLGCAHLAEYKRRFGSLPRALAAYNGGPSRVERWTLPAGRDDDERFVERIPIPETRLYVKRVLAGARMYAIAWPDGLGVTTTSVTEH